MLQLNEYHDDSDSQGEYVWMDTEEDIADLILSHSQDNVGGITEQDEVDGMPQVDKFQSLSQLVPPSTVWWNDGVDHPPISELSDPCDKEDSDS